MATETAEPPAIEIPINPLHTQENVDIAGFPSRVWKDFLQHYLNAKDLSALQVASKQFAEISLDQSLWQTQFSRSFKANLQGLLVLSIWHFIS